MSDRKLMEGYQVRRATGYYNTTVLLRDSREGYFPAPVRPVLSEYERVKGHLWRRSEVERWAKTYGEWTKTLRVRHAAKVHSSVRLMTIKEFARAAQIEEHTLRRIAKKRKRPPFPKPISKPLPGRPSLWREDDVKAWISKRAD